MRRKTKPKIASLFKATSPDRLRHAEVLSLHSLRYLYLSFLNRNLSFLRYFYDVMAH